MRNIHQVVVNYICKVIGWKPVVLYDYLVVYHTVVKDYFPVHHIFKLSFSLWYLHSDDIGFALRLFLRYLVCVVTMRAKPII